MERRLSAARSPRASFSRLSLDFQRPQFSEHAYDSLLELLSASEPTLQEISGSSPLIHGYLSRLTSSSLSSITQEHATLDEEKKDLEHQLSRLAKREYHSFVATASHGDAIASAFEGFDVKVSTVQDKIPSLDNAVAQFNIFAKSQSADREKAQNLLANHDRLLDMLEMPSLVSTCVKNGYFSEAIQLSTHVKRLATLHYTNVPLVQELAAQVEVAMKEMTVRLIGLLREPLKLPSALKVRSPFSLSINDRSSDIFVQRLL
jgi:conserved oligomeric Golgi complex subunit 8